MIVRPPRDSETEPTERARICQPEQDDNVRLSRDIGHGLLRERGPDQVGRVVPQKEENNPSSRVQQGRLISGDVGDPSRLIRWELRRIASQCSGEGNGIVLISMRALDGRPGGMPTKELEEAGTSQDAACEGKAPDRFISIVY